MILRVSIHQSRDDAPQRPFSRPTIFHNAYAQFGITTKRRNNTHRSCRLLEQRTHPPKHRLAVQFRTRFVKTKSRAGAPRHHVSSRTWVWLSGHSQCLKAILSSVRSALCGLRVNSYSSSIGSRPGRRIPNSRSFSCKLCRCSPIVAAVRETFQRCSANCFIKYATSNFRFASRKSCSPIP